MTDRRPILDISRLNARTVLAVMVLGAFVLSMGTLAFFPVPEANKELFSAAMGALNLLVGAIAGYYWPRDDQQPEG